VEKPGRRNTWYKYARLLGIQRNRPKFDKRKTLGIRASLPNEYWHADVTIYELATGVKVYIYLLMDNFSRRVLSWRASDKLTASIRLDTIREALSLIPEPQNINLLVDGGSENNNETVDAFLSPSPNGEGPTCPDSSGGVRKIIAQKEIHFSNSMIEAMNKIMKHAYLAGKCFYSLQALEIVLKESIEDYNAKRPHLSLKGLTPDEAYSRAGIQVIDYQQYLIENRAKRLSINRQNRCHECC
jgi:putative transposase